MDKLRPVEEVWEEACRHKGPNLIRFTEVLQADREAHGELMAKKASRVCLEVTGSRLDARIYQAILAVAKPPEDPRERLGRVACEANNGCYWRDTPDKLREAWCIRAAAVLEEQRKMEEEVKDGK